MLLQHKLHCLTLRDVMFLSHVCGPGIGLLVKISTSFATEPLSGHSVICLDKIVGRQDSRRPNTNGKKKMVTPEWFGSITC